MLESIGLNVKLISESLFSVRERNFTHLEQRQTNTIKHYLEWKVMKDGILFPKPYSFLENIAFRKNAPPKIPKKIHQIWVS